MKKILLLIAIVLTITVSQAQVVTSKMPLFGWTLIYEKEKNRIASLDTTPANVPVLWNPDSYERVWTRFAKQMQKALKELEIEIPDSLQKQLDEAIKNEEEANN